MAKILDTKPSPSAEPAHAAKGFSLIPNEKLIAIYSTMVKCRMFQQKAATLFQQGRLATDLRASSGREACAAAVGVDFQPEDHLSIALGDWLPALVKGIPVSALFRLLAPQINGDSRFVSDEAQRQNIFVHEVDSDRPQIVLDRAQSIHTDKKPAFVAAFLQPLAGATGHWQKVMATAAARRLPIVFVHYVPDDGGVQPHSVLGKKNTNQAVFHGVPTIAVDAADPVALYRVAYEAVTRARQGRGTTLLECTTIPVTPSLASPADSRTVQSNDPIFTMETYLKGKRIQPDHHNREVVANFTRDLDLATRFLDH